MAIAGRFFFFFRRTSNRWSGKHHIPQSSAALNERAARRQPVSFLFFFLLRWESPNRLVIVILKGAVIKFHAARPRAVAARDGAFSFFFLSTRPRCAASVFRRPLAGYFRDLWYWKKSPGRSSFCEVTTPFLSRTHRRWGWEHGDAEVRPPFSFPFLVTSRQGASPTAS